MEVIGHDNKCVQLEPGAMIGKVLPKILNDIPCGAKLHFPLDDFAKNVDIFVGVDGHEVQPWQAVIMAIQTRGGFSDRTCFHHVEGL